MSETKTTHHKNTCFAKSEDDKNKTAPGQIYLPKEQAEYPKRRFSLSGEGFDEERSDEEPAPLGAGNPHKNTCFEKAKMIKTKLLRANLFAKGAGIMFQKNVLYVTERDLTASVARRV